MIGKYGEIVEVWIKPDETEIEQLAEMNFDERLAWHAKHCRYLFGGMYSIKVDGELAAVGYEESFEHMFAAFLMFVARKIQQKETM